MAGCTLDFMKTLKFILGIICLLVGLFICLAFILEYIPHQLINLTTTNNSIGLILGGILHLFLIILFLKFGLKWVKKI